MGSLVRKFFVYAILFLVGLFAFKIFKEFQVKKTIEKNRSVFPDITFDNLDNLPITLPKDKSILVIYYHPDCDFCKEEIDQIKDEMERLKDVNILLISMGNLVATNEFVSNKNLKGYSNIYCVLDKDDRFYKHFGTRTVPSTFIYGKNKMLIKHFKGETKISAILKYLHQDEAVKAQ